MSNDSFIKKVENVLTNFDKLDKLITDFIYGDLRIEKGKLKHLYYFDIRANQIKALPYYSGKYERFYDYELVKKLWKELDVNDNVLLNVFWLRLDNLIEVDEIDFYYRCIEKGIHSNNDFGNYCIEWSLKNHMMRDYIWRLL